VLSYIMINARRSLKTADWYVACHWQLCAHRSKMFIGMLMLLGFVMIGLLISAGGDPSQLKPGHYAIAGVAALPTLVFILALIVMESDALHKARTGQVPEWLVDKHPQPAVQAAAA